MVESRAERVVNRLWTIYSEEYSPFPAENIGGEAGEDTSINSVQTQNDYWQKTSPTCLICRRCQTQFPSSSATSSPA